MSGKNVPFQDLFVTMTNAAKHAVPVEGLVLIPPKNEHQLLFVLGGTAKAQVDRKHSQPILPSDSHFIIKPGHSLQITNQGSHLLNISIVACEVVQLSRAENKLSAASVKTFSYFQYETVSHTPRSLRAMVQKLQEPSPFIGMQKQLENQFLFQKLIYLLMESHASRTDVDPRHAVESTIEYLKLHYDEAITIEDLAGIAQLSRRWYTTLFKEITGENPSDYLIRLRIDKAKELLTMSKESLYAIARKVGFEDEHYFSRRFKQKVGVSPRFYLHNRRILGTTVTHPELMYLLGTIPIAAFSPDQEFPSYLLEAFKQVPKLNNSHHFDPEYFKPFKPDVILAAEWKDYENYDALSRIAPTFLLPSHNDWRDELTDVGEILDKKKQAHRFIRWYDDKRDEVREQLKLLTTNETVAYARMTQEGLIVFGNQSSRGKILYTELGLIPPEKSLLHIDGKILSVEQLAGLGADHIILQTGEQADSSREALLQQPGWRKLMKSPTSRIYTVGHREWYNFSFSPLSTGFAMQHMLQMFERGVVR
ncbi:ABC-type Fe3+-hydroxamate transport system, substrate-binding protein [Paenibacillus algorifonticola]|uniref:ABC-type Fe3+-hydroxamate transport system, substrate-binding protein n=1 Tax=Paenibacillus algorifonticola TaxID=684063 RepID=A0A1I2HQX2_9BACL|nr:helix-turn-helix domain-containing protein [Paenibacillus algorifonticola]SFF31908.1 ABC-type Fe3+-hydroxamate transport system, substrate-binding protein [Paenibacillus algorifonticola]